MVSEHKNDMGNCAPRQENKFERWYKRSHYGGHAKVYLRYETVSTILLTSGNLYIAQYTCEVFYISQSFVKINFAFLILTALHSEPQLGHW